MELEGINVKIISRHDTLGVFAVDGYLMDAPLAQTIMEARAKALKYIGTIARIIGIMLLPILGIAAVADACEIRIIIVNSEMQTWQVCCFPNGACQYTRVG